MSDWIPSLMSKILSGFSNFTLHVLDYMFLYTKTMFIGTQWTLWTLQTMETKLSGSILSIATRITLSAS
jgi:hypothetical protein